MDFGIMFFSSVAPEARDQRYRALIDAARFADTRGLCCVWIPERHFHPFGGLFPNPSVLCAALATITDRLQLRAGSLISPLHDSLRIAENWSVVDNLSGGRVGISFGSGWNADDFVFYPENYDDRQGTMYRQITEVQALWQGQRLRRRSTAGREIEVEIFPKPVQKELPVWVTSSGNVKTFVSAGKIGANVLTHLIGQDLEQLTEKILLYREARAANGFEPGEGKVTLMLHTFLGSDVEEVKAFVHRPFCNYLRSAVSLEWMAAEAGGAISGGHKIDAHDISEKAMEDLVELTFERYFQRASLMGTATSCEPLVWKLETAGVDEIACLIDFVDAYEPMMASLKRLAEFQEHFTSERQTVATQSAVDSFLDEIDV